MSSMTEERVVLKLDERLKVVYEEIGKKYYNENMESDPGDTVYQKLFEEIKKVIQEKNSLEEKKLALHGKKRCASCQNIVTIESKFCNMCGAKLPDVEVVKEERVSTVRKCSGCGSVLENDAIFCSDCGRKNA